MTETLKTTKSATDAILTWDTDDECQDEEEQTIAAEEIVEIVDEAALLSNNSNSNGGDSDNIQCTLTTTNQSRTASAYSVIEKTVQSGKNCYFKLLEELKNEKFLMVLQEFHYW